MRVRLLTLLLVGSVLFLSPVQVSAEPVFGAGYGIVAALNLEHEHDPGALIITFTTIGLLAGWLIDELR